MAGCGNGPPNADCPLAGSLRRHPRRVPFRRALLRLVCWRHNSWCSISGWSCSKSIPSMLSVKSSFNNRGRSRPRRVLHPKAEDDSSNNSSNNDNDRSRPRMDPSTAIRYSFGRTQRTTSKPLSTALEKTIKRGTRGKRSRANSGITFVSIRPQNATSCSTNRETNDCTSTRMRRPCWTFRNPF